MRSAERLFEIIQVLRRAVVLGSQWVVANADSQLSSSALDVLSKISAIMPKHLREMFDDGGRYASCAPEAKRQWHRRREVARLVPQTTETAHSVRRRKWGGEASARSGRFLIGTCRARASWRPGVSFEATFEFVAVECLEERYPEQRRTLRRQWLALMNEKVAKA